MSVTYNPEILDEYVRLTKEKLILEKKIKALKEQLVLEQAGIYQGKENVLEVYEAATYTYDNARLFKKLGRQTFIECATLSKSALLKVCSEAELNKFVKDVSISLRYKEFNPTLAEKYSKKES